MPPFISNKFKYNERIVRIMTDTMICTKCNIEKPLNDFRKFTRNEKEEYRKDCRLCENASRRERYSKNPEKYREKQRKYVLDNKEQVKITRDTYRNKNRDKINKHHLEWVNADVNRVKKLWCGNTINNHTKNGHNVMLTKEELFEISKKYSVCPICGINLKWRQGDGYTRDNPTLDRINNENDVNSTNVWIICSSCNTHKSDKSMKDFIEYCRMIVEKFG